LVLVACLSGCYVITEGLAVPYAQALHGGSRTAGVLLAAGPAGAVVGMWWIGRLPPVGRRRLIAPLAVLASVPLMIAWLRLGPWVTAAAWAVSGWAASYQVPANAAFVQAVPDAHRGQAFGLAVTALRSSQGVGVLAAGALADVIGSPLAISVFGAVGVTLALLLAATEPRGSPAGDPPVGDPGRSGT
jgi:predicted MFS family arabinose efflux permease